MRLVFPFYLEAVNGASGTPAAADTVDDNYKRAFNIRRIKRHFVACNPGIPVQNIPEIGHTASTLFRCFITWRYKLLLPRHLLILYEYCG